MLSFCNEWGDGDGYGLSFLSLVRSVGDAYTQYSLLEHWNSRSSVNQYYFQDIWKKNQLHFNQTSTE